jgi:hypothetical protein
MRILRNLIYPKFRIWKRARKLIVEYDGSNFRVVSDRRVSMAPAPSNPIADYQNQIGFWYTVIDARGRVLHRKLIPELSGPEVFTNNPREQLYRLGGAPRITTLVLAFPDFPEAVRVELFASRLTNDGRFEPASSLAAFSLTQDQRGGKHGRK